MEFTRQLDIFNPEGLSKKIYVIGVGATGSYTSLALAKMGIKDIRVFDDDTIEEHNFPNQIFPLKHIGENKTKALKEIIKDYTGIEIVDNPFKYENQPLSGIVISAVDSMITRKRIYKQCKDNPQVDLLIDPRSGKEAFTIYTINPNVEEDMSFYESKMYTDDEAESIPCTARNIIYSVLSVSAYICGQVKRYLKDGEYKKEIISDMNNNVLLSK